MTEEMENEITVTDDIDGSAIGNAIDVVGEAVSGAPSQIKKNAFKAFSQLCTAAIDIPVAHLEGIATEKRAETQARIKVINTGAEQIAKQMTVDPEYARVAVKKYGQKIVREQVNLDVISENAARELALESPKEANNKSKASVEQEISGDWLNTFEKEACNKSSDEMRLLFGKILAGEIRKPSSYSIKTLRLISQLDNKAAKLFQVYCSLCVSLQPGGNIHDARVVTVRGNAASNSLQLYGLSFDDFNVLHEYGLIVSDYNSSMNYGLCIANSNNEVSLPFKHQGKFFGLLPQDERKHSANVSLKGVVLSHSGKELLNVIDLTPSENYTSALREYFQNQEFQMVEIHQS